MPSRDLQDLHPVLRRKVLQMRKSAAERGIPFIETQTGRTLLEQAAFYAQGREPLALVNHKREMAGLPIITWKQNERKITWVTTSVHQFGLGVDIVLKKAGGGVHWDTKADINADGDPDYEELGKVGEALGLIWGGRFKSKDLVHFEWTGGLTLKELKAGKRPPMDIPETAGEPEKKTMNQNRRTQP